MDPAVPFRRKRLLHAQTSPFGCDRIGPSLCLSDRPAQTDGSGDLSDERHQVTAPFEAEPTSLAYFASAPLT